MRYVTRGNTEPNGKDKILVIGHSDDLIQYEEQINTIFLSRLNCALCYINGTNDEEMESDILDIDSMRFAVIPLTDKSLTCEVPLFDRLFAKVNEKNVAVLPLAMEPITATLQFEARFGSVQYLEPNQTDVTKVDFSKKLDDFLDKHILKDKIKLAEIFERHMFLSYRKSDRAYARDLISTIHRIERFQSIAIWYDENLMGGEDYVANINSALDESDAFLLAVTPRILELNCMGEENYVMREEYPRATCISGLPIVPVEFEPTDRSTLYEAFEGLEKISIIPFEDCRLLCKQIEDIFGITSEEELSPKFMCNLGKAYLYGVAVEVNRTLALELLKRSSDSGYVDAGRQLVKMYRTGDGVKRNLNTAIEYQQAVLNGVIRVYAENPEIGCEADILGEMLELGNCYAENRDYRGAEAIYLSMKKKAETFGREKYFIYIQYACDGLCDVIQKQGSGREDEIQLYAEESLACSDEFQRRVTGGLFAVADRDRGITYEKLGSVYLQKGDYVAAIDYFTKELEIFFERYEGSESPDLQKMEDLMRAYNNLGIACMHSEDTAGIYDRLHEKAVIFFRKAARLAKEIAAERQEENDHLAYLRILKNVADGWNVYGDRDESYKYYVVVTDFAKQIYKAFESPEALLMLKESYFRMAELSSKTHTEIGRVQSEMEQSIEFSIKHIEVAGNAQERANCIRFLFAVMECYMHFLEDNGLLDDAISVRLRIDKYKKMYDL